MCVFFLLRSSRNSSFKVKASRCLLPGSSENETLVWVLQLNVSKEAGSEKEKVSQSPKHRRSCGQLTMQQNQTLEVGEHFRSSGCSEEDLRTLDLVEAKRSLEILLVHLPSLQFMTNMPFAGFSHVTFLRHAWTQAHRGILCFINKLKAPLAVVNKIKARKTFWSV